MNLERLQIFGLLLGLFFVLSLFSFGRYLLYPFKLFTTWLHECSHAFMALVMGGSVTKLTLHADTSGLAQFTIPDSRLRHAMVASAGYLGSATLGCLIFYLSVLEVVTDQHLYWAIGGLLLLSLAYWVRNLFGVLTVAAMGAGFILLGLHLPELQARAPASVSPAFELFLPFLGIQAGVSTLFDLRGLFGMDPKAKSDAQVMQTLLWLPAPLWALLWICGSLALMGWIGWLALRT